jgi:tetratricopeptide (TPR) repeat protein
MGTPLDPAELDRLQVYEALLREVEGHGLRFFTRRYGIVDGKTIRNALDGRSLHLDSRLRIAALIKRVEENFPWLLIRYAERGPAHLFLDLELVQRSNHPDTLFSAACLLYSQSHFRKAADLLAAAATSFHAKGELQQEAKVLRMHASCAAFSEDHKLSARLLSRAVRLSRLTGDVIGEINGLEGLSFNSFQGGNLAGAEKTYQEIKARAEKHDPTCFGCCCYGIGRVLQRSDPGQAIEWHQRGIDAFGTNEIGLGNCHYGLGLAFFKLKDWDQARAELQEAERLYRRWSNNVGISACLQGLADLASRRA